MTRIALIVMALLISGCSEWSLKRSANNKLIDFSGFEGSKRRPLYNKKYITRAKRNIVDNNYEEDDYDGTDEADEISDPASANRSMYKGMTKRDAKSRAASISKGRASGEANNEDARGYPRLGRARSIVDEGDSKSSDELQREIGELKKMMVETKKDLAKYRCPMQGEVVQPQSVYSKAQSDYGNSKAHSLSNNMGVD